MFSPILAGMQNPPSVRDLYPTLTERELKEAETNLLRYFEIALDIYKELNTSHIDTSPAFPKMEERSNISLKN